MAASLQNEVTLGVLLAFEVENNLLHTYQHNKWLMLLNFNLHSPRLQLIEKNVKVLIVSPATVKRNRKARIEMAEACHYREISRNGCSEKSRLPLIINCRYTVG